MPLFPGITVTRRRLLPTPPGVPLRRFRGGQRVRLVVLTPGRRKEPVWVVRPGVLVVGRCSSDTVVLHDEDAWGRSRAFNAQCPIACEVDRETRCVPV